MNNPQQGSRLTPETLRWARRAILERLAGKDDKVYLFQLLSDVSEDLRDREMMIRALAETLPIAGERRTTQLRELMELARVGTKDKEDMLRFGRRLIGMGEIIPPQVYLDLGSVFLESGDIRNAVKTFDQCGRRSRPWRIPAQGRRHLRGETLRHERPAQLRETAHHRSRRCRSAGEGRRTQGTAGAR